MCVCFLFLFLQGGLLKKIDHHPFRPAHLHLIITAKGFKPLVTSLFPEDDPYIFDDVVFGVKHDLVKKLEASAADGGDVAMSHDFFIVKDEAYSTLDPLNFVPQGSASNFASKEETETKQVTKTFL